MTREEAIKTIMSAAVWTDDEREALGVLIPELKESEDERIRKEIIDFIQWADARGSVRSDWHQKKKPGMWITYLEKQKEQKSVKCSDADKDMISCIISSLRGYMCLASKSPYYTNHKTHIQKEIDWLEVLSLNLKKSNEAAEKLCSNEWSEEDEKMLDWCESVIRGFEIDHCNDDKSHSDWLKSFHPQYPEDFFKEGIGHYFFDGEKTHFCGSPSMETNFYELGKNIQNK